MNTKFTLFLLALSLSAASASAQMLDTVRIKVTGLDGTVPVSSDDAEQLNNEIDKLYDDDLDMGWEGDEFNVVITGLRFTDINVPKNAVIDSAFIEIYAHEDEGDLSLVTVRIEDNSNPVTYNETDLITARTYVNDTIFWQISEDWEIWTLYRTPELKKLVQAVVNRADWAPGGAMAFMFSGQDQGASTEDNARDFESFENVEDPDDGGDGLNHPTRIPKLYIYYRMSSSTRNIEQTNLSVAPNPVQNGIINLDLTPFTGSDVTVSLFSPEGRLVRQWQMPQVAPALLPLNIGDVPAGMYQLEVAAPSLMGTTKVVVK